jgi:hypothetical protein
MRPSAGRRPPLLRSALRGRAQKDAAKLALRSFSLLADGYQRREIDGADRLVHDPDRCPR